MEADLADLRALLDARPADEPVMRSVREVVEVLAGRMESGREADVRLAPLLHDEPALRQRYLGVLDRVEETVADWARLRLAAGPEDLRPGLLAACMVSVQRVVVDAMMARAIHGPWPTSSARPWPSSAGGSTSSTADPPVLGILLRVRPRVGGPRTCPVTSGQPPGTFVTGR